MFAEVKQFQWTDVEDDTVVPNFPTLLEMYVTSPGHIAVLRFEVAVTTIEELTQRLNFQSCISGHGQWLSPSSTDTGSSRFFGPPLVRCPPRRGKSSRLR
ncbi:hypothetical protein QFZ33_003220 [Arthrobacter globiformis]|nr:hypothetical protein [Arthrobacter globiformis]